MPERLIVVAPEPSDFHITREQFLAAMPYWEPHARLAGSVSDDDPVDANIQVDRPDEYFFQIFHFQNERMLSTDGNWEQAVEFAIWAVNSFPKQGDGELWLVDQAYTGHVVLTPGMPAEAFETTWVEHD
ncbi:hypothetical protein [Kineosporia babensis]|uniref:Uncharacterized protein n=1 Tax=Kineosporia babensis TaxID=499548 RepID=A0A9X1NK20_9ACTN|nr:hypothetical protein [Kineosporia babensis]MCD5315019.1 hypothetical protein [Kineosporia babensis]